ncbi:thiopeptide-type bacteriocin biosynthesis protein [Idiomarina xiamenensis]|uniref:Thiopeptide-type bacteriocin biosynthesis domain-containing protein n=1 Tax=Idiomarina xiamenensis 10-D-4 TaxID=740709 RepID=K2LCF6_9GAMM|nr:thiopeptide-type bacteriocin biosynthesis protein [Idiomarina xiamenensis]EKE87555.1 hypothetical protein A10D4_00635 [Idiomarina xiamenensis 10-D-4]
MTTTHAQRWSAFHVFLHDTEQQEVFLQQQLPSLVRTLKAEQQTASWFFLRYWDGGPHIRVRFESLQQPQQVLNQLQDSARQLPAQQALSAEQYYANHSFDGQPMAIDELDWHHDGEVKQFPYEPEYARYGGESALVINERLFSISSEVALAIIAATQGQLNQRLQLSLKMIICSVFTVNPSLSSVKQFATYYAEFWRSHAAGVQVPQQADPALRKTIARSLDEVVEQQVTGVIGTWLSYLSHAIDEWRRLYREQQLVSPLDGQRVETDEQCEMAIMSMVGSQIHMLNNRLGVTPAYEFFLAERIRIALSTADQRS